MAQKRIWVSLGALLAVLALAIGSLLHKGAPDEREFGAYISCLKAIRTEFGPNLRSDALYEEDGAVILPRGTSWNDGFIALTAESALEYSVKPTANSKARFVLSADGVRGRRNLFLQMYAMNGADPSKGWYFAESSESATLQPNEVPVEGRIILGSRPYEDLRAQIGWRLGRLSVQYEEQTSRYRRELTEYTRNVGEYKRKRFKSILAHYRGDVAVSDRELDGFFQNPGRFLASNPMHEGDRRILEDYYLGNDGWKPTPVTPMMFSLTPCLQIRDSVLNKLTKETFTRLMMQAI